MSVYPTAANRNRVVSVHRVRQESPSSVTILFRDVLCSKSKSGQFAMVWAPGVDEVPMSISVAEGRTAGVTVERVGAATEALHRLREGDLIGVRGPLGNHFKKTVSGKALLVGGGTGVAGLMLLGKELLQAGTHVTFAIGARTDSELLFLDTIESMFSHPPHALIVTTDDGSRGAKGFVTDPLGDVLRKGKFGAIYTCGPESMMRKVVDLGLKFDIPVQASLERIVKCGIGVCGSCCLGPYTVCKDGPIFSSDQLREVSEFGSVKRSHSGKLIRLLGFPAPEEKA